MTYVISGSVCEQESKRPVPGLIVRTVDQDGRYGQLLKTTVTGADGRFRIEYTESEAGALFKTQPRVAVRVYAPPLRLLLDSPWVQWGVRAEERVALQAPRRLLGPLSPSRPDGVVEVSVRVAPDALKIEKQGEFDAPRLSGFPNGGPVGAPALPEQVQYVVLPLRARVTGLEVEPGKPVRLPRTVRPLPVQEPTPDSQLRPGEPAMRRPVFAPLHPRFTQGARPYPEALVVRGSAARYHFAQVVTVRVRPVQYDPTRRTYLFYPNLRYRVRYEAATARPEAEKRAVHRLTEQRLREMQVFFDRDVTYVAKDVARDLADLAEGGIADAFLELRSPDMIILTDDYAWADGLPTGESWDDRPPEVPIPAPGTGRLLGRDGLGNGVGPTAAFQRLADWKMQRGVRTLVVTVTDILDQKYGDCTDGGFARDLPEVIRNFVKKAYDDWGFHYLLIGGSSRIVPMRYLLAYCSLQGSYAAWDFTPYTLSQTSQLDELPPRCCAVDPADPNKVYLCHDSVLGRPTSVTLLCASFGQDIPFKETPGDGQAGWYFATKEFAHHPGPQPAWYPARKNDAYTVTAEGTDVCNLIVEGPGEVVDERYYWAFNPDRFIPSDLYYACLEANDVCLETNEMSPPPPPDLVARPAINASTAGYGSYVAKRHDLDLISNRLYGQFRWDQEKGEEVIIDSRLPAFPDVWVGRAPVDNGDEAEGFVDKVLTYERLQTPEGEALDPEYLKRIVLAADVMDGPMHLADQEPNWRDTAVPEPGTFSYWPDKSCILVCLQQELVDHLSAPDGARSHVLARFHDPAIGPDIDVPRASSSDAPGWHYCEGESDQFALTTEVTGFVKIVGPVASVKPWRITWLFGPADANDGGATDCEYAHSHFFAPEFDQFSDVHKYYVEYLNFSPRKYQLTPPKIRAQLDLGCHFLVLRGHGDFNGLAKVWWYETEGSRPDFRNRDRYFIAYAQSCYTAQPDYVRSGQKIRSLGEAIVAQPGGGAVAYVSYTRLGLGGSARQHEIFWRNLKQMGRLGPAAGTPSHGNLSLDDMWQLYNQVLYGDPEMPVWTAPPHTYEVVHPDYIDVSQDTLQIYVLHDGQPVKGQRVTLMSGALGPGAAPALLMSRVTNACGLAAFSLDQLPDFLPSVMMTVTRDDPGQGANFKPYWVDLAVCSFQKRWYRCTKCQTLFFHYSEGEEGTENDCPAGGSHQAAAGEHYRLIVHSPKAPAQPGWKWCKICQALFLTDGQADRGGVCHDGQPHDGSGSSEYAVVRHEKYSHDSVEWRYCKKCKVLHCAGGSGADQCFAGDSHSTDGDDVVAWHDVFLVPAY